MQILTLIIKDMKNVNQFLAEIKIKCENKAVEMAKLELSVWNENHEKELKSNFGFNNKKLNERKNNLKNKVK